MGAILPGCTKCSELDYVARHSTGFSMFCEALKQRVLQTFSQRDYLEKYLTERHMPSPEEGYVLKRNLGLSSRMSGFGLTQPSKILTTFENLCFGVLVYYTRTSILIQ